MCRASLRFSQLSFIPPVPYPPLRGTFPLRGRLWCGDSDSLANGALETISHSLSYRHCPIRLTSLATFPLRGRLYVEDSDALIYDTLETIFSLSFIPLPPSNLRPFGAPPSIGRRECPREPLPLEGAAERSEAGLASFGGGEAPSSLPSPLGKGDRAAALGCSYIACLRRSPTLFFIPLVPYPARSARHLPHAGKALCRGQRHSHKCRASILRKQKPLCEDGLCRAVSGSIILRSRILRDFSAYPHHFLS